VHFPRDESGGGLTQWQHDLAAMLPPEGKYDRMVQIQYAEDYGLGGILFR
jgi:hypothetical protein